VRATLGLRDVRLALNPLIPGKRPCFVTGNKRGRAAVLQSNSGQTAELTKVSDTTRRERFEQTVLPHLDAAYNLARWLTRNDQDAQDMTQEACLHAFRFFDGYKGGNMRAWFLSIVRNTCCTWLRKNRATGDADMFDEDIHSVEIGGRADPEIQALTSADKDALQHSIEELPPAFREALVLRELEGMSYREIAEVTSVSMGTVMSRLARARTHLRQSLSAELCKGY
jgi:RNA polymerase sigma-70 factor (ECF subfamily)